MQFIPRDILSIVVSFLNVSSVFAMGFVYGSVKGFRHPTKMSELIIDSIDETPSNMFYWLSSLNATLCYDDTFSCCKKAANVGNLKIVKSMFLALKQFEFGTGLVHSGDIFVEAVNGGHLNVMQWLRDTGCRWNVLACEAAAKKGYFEILKWLHKEGCPWDETTFSGATFANNFEMVKWLHKEGCRADIYCSINVASNGNLEMLRFLTSNGSLQNKTVCGAAAKNGHLEILKWAMSEAKTYRFQWNNTTCANAAYGGHLEVLKWARENGCPR